MQSSKSSHHNLLEIVNNKTWVNIPDLNTLKHYHCKYFRRFQIQKYALNHDNSIYNHPENRYLKLKSNLRKLILVANNCDSKELLKEHTKSNTYYK